jgi:hypothetical protein
VAGEVRGELRFERGVASRGRSNRKKGRCDLEEESGAPEICRLNSGSWMLGVRLQDAAADHPGACTR